MTEPEIRLNTVGIIGAGSLAGKYILVIPRQIPGRDIGYKIFVSIDTTFAFKWDTKQYFDLGLEDRQALDAYFERFISDIRWDEQITPPNFDAKSQEIRIGVVGVIGTGEYAGWYILILPRQQRPEYPASYKIFMSTNATFAYNADGQKYRDHWVWNQLELEDFFEPHAFNVRWDEQITPPTFGAMSQEIRIGVVGIIGAGQYAGWYIFIRINEHPGYEASYTVFICTDTTFAFNPAERGCYDNWAENFGSLGIFFEKDYFSVRWDDSITPPKWGPPSPQIVRLQERMRERLRQHKADKNKPAGNV